MQFTEGISSPPLSISRGKIFGRCVTKGGLRAARRLFVSVRNSAQVSDIRRTYPVFLEFTRLRSPISLDWTTFPERLTKMREGGG